MHILPTRVSSMICVLLLSSALVSEPTVSGAEQMSDFIPTGRLGEDKTEDLPMSPTQVVVLDEDAYAVGSDGDRSLIVHFDGADFAISNEADLPFLPDDVISSADGQLLYLIGTKDGATELLVLNKSLEQVGAIVLKERPVAYASLSEAENGVLLVGGMKTDAVDGALFALDVSDPTAPALIPEKMPDDYNLFGATGAWLDNRGTRTLFVNTGQLPALVAFGAGKRGITEYADISFSSDNSASGTEPLVTLGFMPGRLCSSEEISKQASFLISSNRVSTLFWASFDPDFLSLDILATTSVNLPISTKVARKTYAYSEVFQPTSLLASSCNQGVIWIGNNHSTEIEQFAVNPDLQSLEKIGQISLGFLPEDIAVSASGRVAYAISSERNSISRFLSEGGVVSGTQEARSIQRMLTERGYPVGAIDGQIGQQTLGALTRFEKNNNLSVDLDGDLNQVIEMIKKVPFGG